MSPFFQRVPAFGGLFPARPYGEALRADGVTDSAFAPSSATTGFRGARPAFGKTESVDLPSGKDVLVAWRRSVGQIPGLRYDPHTTDSRWIFENGASDVIWVPKVALGQAEAIAKLAGASNGFQTTVDAYWVSPTEARLTVLWSRGPLDLDEFARILASRTRASGKLREEANLGTRSYTNKGGRSAYGRDEIELTVGSIGYRGDSVTAIILATIGAAVVLRGG
jgi:hypothetical protein